MSEIKMVPFMFVKSAKAERSATPREGMTTPWGRADHVKPLIDGAWFVGTPSHGGDGREMRHDGVPCHRGGTWHNWTADGSCTDCTARRTV